MTEKQIRFCDEYMIDLNATQAAIRAGYSARSAGTNGPRLLGNAGVRARIDEAMAEQSRRTGVTAERVVRELARLAFVNAPDVIDMRTARLREDATEDDRATIASIKVKTGDQFTEREIRMCDKVKALELLGRHLGMFTDNVKLTDDRPIVVDDIPGGADNA